MNEMLYSIMNAQKLADQEIKGINSSINSIRNAQKLADQKINEIKSSIHTLRDDVSKYNTCDDEMNDKQHECYTLSSITTIIPQAFTNVDSLIEFNGRLGTNSLERKKLVFNIIQLAYFVNTFLASAPVSSIKIQYVHI